MIKIHFFVLFLKFFKMVVFDKNGKTYILITKHIKTWILFILIRRENDDTVHIYKCILVDLFLMFIALSGICCRLDNIFPVERKIFLFLFWIMISFQCLEIQRIVGFLLKNFWPFEFWIWTLLRIVLRHSFLFFETLRIKRLHSTNSTLNLFEREIGKYWSNRGDLRAVHKKKRGNFKKKKWNVL